MGYEQTIDRLHECYKNAQVNSFVDAWGIVMSAKMFEELKSGCNRCLQKDIHFDEYATVFGLVIIATDILPYDMVYIVEETLGRILMRTLS